MSIRSSLMHIDIGATDEQIKEGLQQMQIDGLDSKYDLERKMLEFCYIKQILAGTRQRQYKIRCLLNPSSAPGDEEKLEFGKAHNRLLRLLSTREGDTTSETIPANVQSTSAAMESLSRWESQDAFILTRDHPLAEVKGYSFQRVQKCQTCGFVTSAAISDYTVLMDNPQSESLMLNLISFIRAKYSRIELEQYIFREHENMNLAILKSCLDAGTKLTRISDLSRINRDLLIRLGPGIISNFRVHKDFKNSDILSFLDEPGSLPDEIERHTMLLIGVRERTTSEPQVFFVQNWGAKKQYIEFTADYLNRAQAKVHFVYDDQEARINHLAPRGHTFSTGV